jgi:hypothetical protein
MAVKPFIAAAVVFAASSSAGSSQDRSVPEDDRIALEYPEPEINEQLVLANGAFRDLLSRRYGELDVKARELRTSKARFRNGAWKLSLFYMAFDSLGTSKSWYPIAFEGQNPDWNEVFSRLKEWRDERPASVTARIALAQAWMAYAWEARGTSYAHKVNDQQWALFHERLAESARLLDEAKGLEEKCPEWWDAAMKLALGQGWDKARYRALMEEAVAFEPEYDSYYSSQAYFLLPRWYGEPGEWQREAGRWMERFGSPRGEEIYARIVWSFRNLGIADELIEETEIDWALTKRSFLHMRQKYPDSFEIESLFAVLSRHARDRAQARALMESIGNRMDRGVWRSERQFRSARKWALPAEERY